jgi:hypothetical protein
MTFAKAFVGTLFVFLVSSLRNRFNTTDGCGILCHALHGLPLRAQAW